ncbi:hypothetical protein FRD01_12985 [Microvenator marinus]|uniref:Uncharacterized protein n=1 Tax=Microvenator marinus TaxID=2600177 RepID=A0A5B8XXF1_9DELT|nr:hypothetical protein [Microvenator marinus]QED28129.1 hypothetical protein FRD01_12985 [Microvenator marinus]
MKIRTLMTLISMTFLIGTSACSTADNAQTNVPAAQVEQTQHSMTDDHAAHHPEGQKAGADQANDHQQMMAQMCPMQVEGTTRKVVKLDDGVGMDFTTTGDVDELRRRVEKMAQMHAKMHSEGGMMQGQHGQHDQMKHGEMHGKMHGEMTDEQRQKHQEMKQMMSGVAVSTVSINGGMRMMFTPKDAVQVDKLYEMMEKHSQMMGEQGQCPMMQMMGGESKGHSHE